jgi:lipopolysaccharide/colanic/teichoic acid biosynthesis glycosyltransferase
LDQVIDIHKIDEVIFCAKDISAGDIISKMLSLEGEKLDFKIAQPQTSFLIGSNSIDTQGDLYVMDINKINKPANQRNKRIIDVFIALLALLFSPFIIWFFRYKKRFLTNMVNILRGSISFVGYAPINHSSNLKLPKIKRGLLSSVLMVKDYQTLSADAVSRLNLIYAKNHSFLVDLKIIMNHFSKWDN